MAIEKFNYISYAEPAFIHIELMRLSGETRIGVYHRSLVESALARPRQAAAYEGADLIRQAATLCFGMIKNHPWVGGNKRAATAITSRFLLINGMRIIATTGDRIEMVLAVEADRWGVDEIDNWLRQHTAQKI
ncbi:MAG: type II toxin-antitoxin system death-on-curing family toxin [Acidobacteria bacterium]|nr:type II toxin-antitoxin system death-on-curing family toxin [Acidobacteriota bacterium]